MFQKGKVGQFRVHQLYHIKLASIIDLAGQLSSILIYNEKDSQVQDSSNDAVKGRLCLLSYKKTLCFGTIKILLKTSKSKEEKKIA